ncbi:hypothetical protein A4X09_0g1432 [Tilletia walkeri]|uniref:Uncharacterized protein n=1 Tax=Tilletia walkeri TaxID=117179 RepID=A0A8X7NFA2_9BASI|nr:hypothetical protein A4X09_0g1432 [Tilletia walkeri]
MQSVAPRSAPKRSSKLPELDRTEELTPAQRAKWSVKVAGRAENAFPVFASAGKEVSSFSSSKAGTSKAAESGLAPAGSKAGGSHVGTSIAGALHEASRRLGLSDASLTAQHAFTLGALPTASNFHAGGTIGVPSSSFRREDQRTTRSGQVLRQTELLHSSNGAQELPLLERPSQTFVSAVGGSRSVLPEEVHPFRLPYTVKRPRPDAWHAWTDEAVKELEAERQQRIRQKRKERKLANAQDGDDVDNDEGDDDSLLGDELDGGDDEGERPVRLSIRKSMVLLQSLRQSRLLHMTALLPPFSIRNGPPATSVLPHVDESRAGSQSKRTRHGMTKADTLPQVRKAPVPEYSYICPLPPTLTHHFDLRQPHFLLQLGCADVRIGPHLFTKTKFWEVRPDTKGVHAARMAAAQRTKSKQGLEEAQDPDQTATQTPRRAASAILNAIPPEGIWANDPDYRPRPPIIVVEFPENPSMRYVLPLWATAVECTRFLRGKPSGDKSKDKPQYELVLTFGVPALGSAARSHSAALIGAEMAAREKVRREKEAAAQKAKAEAEAARKAAEAAVVATVPPTVVTPEPAPPELPVEAEPRGTMTRSRQSTQQALAVQKPAGPAADLPTVPTARQATPPPLPPTHPTLGLKNQDWLVTWRLRGEGSAWTGLHDSTAVVDQEGSFERKELSETLREAFGRVPGALQYDHFPDWETQEEASARREAELEAAAAAKKPRKKRKVVLETIVEVAGEGEAVAIMAPVPLTTAVEAEAVKTEGTTPEVTSAAATAPIVTAMSAPTATAAAPTATVTAPTVTAMSAPTAAETVPTITAISEPPTITTAIEGTSATTIPTTSVKMLISTIAPSTATTPVTTAAMTPVPIAAPTSAITSASTTAMETASTIASAITMNAPVIAPAIAPTTAMSIPPARAAPKSIAKTASDPNAPPKKSKRTMALIKNAKRQRILRRPPSSSCWPPSTPEQVAEGEEHFQALTRAFANVLQGGPAERSFPILSLDSPAMMPAGLKEEVADPARPRLRVYDEEPALKKWRRDEGGHDEWALIKDDDGLSKKRVGNSGSGSGGVGAKDKGKKVVRIANV